MQFLANKAVFILTTSILFGAPIAVAIYFVANNYQDVAVNDAPVESVSHLNPRLVAIKPNQWMKINSPWSLAWNRQAHAGIAYNSNQGSLLIFGSETHNKNWDNSIHEFNPVNEKWNTHQTTSDHIIYLLDDKNRAVAGVNEPRPWAMHTYDNIVYDPKNNSLFVTATPDHNPKNQEFENIKHAMWIYNLDTHKWKIFENNGKPYPVLFAGATEYDPERDAIVAYKSGVWELGPDRKEWIKASSENHHDIHYNMEYDKKNKQFVIFGDNTSDSIWSYQPGPFAGAAGIWTQHQPTGDLPPKDVHFPVAYDEANNVFLLTPRKSTANTDNTTSANENNIEISDTYIYDLTKNQYTKLPQTELPIHDMNYMMVYDNYHNVFLLVTGDDIIRPTVWAFKLDLRKLDKSSS